MFSPLQGEVATKGAWLGPAAPACNDDIQSVIIIKFLLQLFSSGRHQRQLSMFRNLNFVKRFCDLTW